MKENKIKHRRRGKTLLVIGLVLVALLLGGLLFGYSQIRALYLEQSVLTDTAEQISIIGGKMVKADVIAENLGLRKGANLAEIDFEAKRRDILRRVPTLRNLTIVRQTPNRLIVRAEERIPAVRLNTVGNRKPSGRVADAEGMVFYCQRGTQALPILRETSVCGTSAGQILQGRMRAALDLVLACRDGELNDLGVLEVDTAKTDFLVATLGDYSRVKICWDGMNESTPASRAALNERLGNLLKIIRNKQGLRAVIWNATLPDYIFADTQEKL